ncbi:MAG TPA: hypothetical protein VEL11_09350 [Candidatus Bathyarchaeia archaeon]|nr:hypothetical protein [Candidatus Bathyarchaeia archaeon]
MGWLQWITIKKLRLYVIVTTNITSLNCIPGNYLLVALVLPPITKSGSGRSENSEKPEHKAGSEA